MREADRRRADVLVSGLYAEYGRSVLLFVIRLTGDRTGAEDIVQETLVRAWKHADDLVEDKGSVLGWLLTVARNLVADRARARALRPLELGDIGERSRVHGDHSDSVVNTMMLGDALRQVSAAHRDVVVELYYRGRSVTEAARELGVPPGTVKSRSYYALRALRTLISASGP